MGGGCLGGASNWTALSLSFISGMGHPLLNGRHLSLLIFCSLSIFHYLSRLHRFSLSLTSIHPHPQPCLQVTLRFRSIFPLNPFPRVIIKERSVTSISNSLSPSRLAGFCIWVTGVTARLAPLRTSRNDLTLARLTPLRTSGNDLTLAKKKNQDGSFLTASVIWPASQN